MAKLQNKYIFKFKIQMLSLNIKIIILKFTFKISRDICRIKKLKNGRKIGWTNEHWNYLHMFLIY